MQRIYRKRIVSAAAKDCGYPSFTGDDSCYVIKEREEYEKRHRDWRIG
jgi:hypothetical protein